MLISNTRDEDTRRSPGHTPRIRVSVVVIGLVVAAAALAGCGGSSHKKSTSSTSSTEQSGGSDGAGFASAKPGGTLTFGIPSAPTTMDAAKDAYTTYSLMRYLSNEPLLLVNPSTGAVGPGLATAYSYVGANNMAFQLTLRHDARFSDGTPVTASAVKAWLEYFVKAGGPQVGQIPIKSIATPDQWTVKMTFTEPTPGVPFLLSGIDNYGFVTGPKGLSKPASLATTTDGAGPYVLDPSASVTGDHYTFVPSKHYYDQGAIKWNKIVAKVIASPSTMLQAVQSGQVDVAIGDPATAATAESDGLTVKYAPQGWDGITFTDRNGKSAKPLGNVLVRQALNYAVNRKAITTAMLGKFGTPTDQWDSTDGFDPAYQNYYSYDPAKAKQLLAKAGYPNGFTLPVVDQGYTGNLGDPLVQAIAQDLKAVGVTLKITTDSTSPAFLKHIFSTSYPAWGNSWGAAPLHIFYDELFTPKGSVNPFGVTDATITQLATQATKAAPSEAAGLWKQLSHRMVEQGDMLAVTQFPSLVYTRPNVGGVTVTRWFLFTSPATQWFPN
jgi:peptide/nickel transport system substrate-binding protein